MLPYRERLIHVRWSGEACWIPLGGLDLGLGYESATSYPAPGQLLFHPGGISAGMCDGSVRFIRESIDIRTFARLVTAQAGEVVGDF